MNNYVKNMLYGYIYDLLERLGISAGGWLKLRSRRLVEGRVAETQPTGNWVPEYLVRWSTFLTFFNIQHSLNGITYFLQYNATDCVTSELVAIPWEFFCSLLWNSFTYSKTSVIFVFLRWNINMKPYRKKKL